MPTLGQSNSSIYGQIDLPKPLNIGGDQPAAGRVAGPNAAMARLASEQQKDQQIQQLASQYGDDYDGLVKAVTTVDPERGLKMQQTLSEARKAEAQNRLSQTESSLKSMTWVEDGVKLAIQDPSQYPKLLQSLAKQPGGSQFLQYAPDPNDPDLKQKLQNILPVFVDTKDFQKVSQQSYRDYLNGDLELSALRKLSAADTPQKRQMVESELKGAGLADYILQYPDAASAKQAFDALVAQKQAEKPESGDKAKDLIANTTGGLTGSLGVQVATYMQQHGLTDVRQVPPPVIRQLQHEEAEAKKIVISTPGATPEDIKSDIQKTVSGKSYIDLGDYETPKARQEARAAAKDAGVPIVAKDVGQSLKAADTARLNINSMWNQIKGKLPKDAQGRILGGPGNKLSAYFQTDADLAAFNSWRAAAIQATQALVEKGMGFRLNKSEIDMIMNNDMPQITDDIPTAYRRVKNVIQLLNNKESIALSGNDRSGLLSPTTGTPPKNPYAK
jgi:hypothetical protein